MPSIRALGSLTHVVAIVFVFVFVFVFGCSQRLDAPIGAPTDGPPKRGGKLTLATFVQLRSVDPAVAFDEGSEPIVRLLFARLFRVSRSGEITGDLVEQHRLTSDGLQLTMHLRRNAKFHDGSAVLASDVKRSLERALHPKTPCPVPSFYNRIAGFEAFHNGQADELRGIQVLSDHVVRIELREPDATLLPILTLNVTAPVCRSAGKTYDPNFSLEACGAGPFRLERWEGQEALELRRHDGFYAADRTYLDGIRWMFDVKSSAQRFRFERGELDIVSELSAADDVAFRVDPRWRSLGAWTRPRSTRGVFMNTEMVPFDNADVRRAVTHAIDKEQAASLWAGHLLAANSMIPSGVIGHDPNFQGQRHDLAKALALMKRAGYAYDPSADSGGYPETIDYYCTVDSLDCSVGEIYQQQLHRIGIRIRIKAVSWGAYLALTGRRKHARMGSDGWSADFDDPNDFFEPLFSTGAIQDNESQNRSFYSNPELDALLERARRETNPAVRRKAYRRADEIVRDDAPWAIVYGVRRYIVHQGYVQGHRPHPHAFQDVDSVWIDGRTKGLAAAARGAPPTSLNALALSLKGRKNQ